MQKILTIIATLMMTITAMAGSGSLLDEGISEELARHRKQTILELRYALAFSIPESVSSPVSGNEIITFRLKKKDDIIIDFREAKEKIHSVKVNGKASRYVFYNEHIVIPAKETKKGKNSVQILFEAGNQSLNRREGYMYTLFVPDRARTVFPCFEQPNLKAQFSLMLDVPREWKAVSNGAVKSQQGGHIVFNETEPLPTYLFAFAAGDFKYQTYTDGGRTIGAYYRETDPKRIAQLKDIFRQVMFSLKWQEEFTGVPYPFQKYDLVILPGFQFGGMEHTGATFYNDNTLFLPENPTPDEQLRRTELISHETSHMWFGDAVTMEWFDDVWTKEVFANYFAAEITAPLFPELDHNLNWLKTYVTAAISQDRTEGRTSIRQPLSNMRYAGLIYNNIIYNKAPVMLRKMVQLMGKDAFRRGIQKYVKKYLYGNATWDDLIRILDDETKQNLKAFSKEWVDKAHFPHYKAKTYLDGKDGQTYGFIELTKKQLDDLLDYWPDAKNGTERQALLMTLHENYLAGNIADGDWAEFLIDNLDWEDDYLTASTLTSYLREPMLLITKPFDIRRFEKSMLKMAQHHTLKTCRTIVLRQLAAVARTQETAQQLYTIWEKQTLPLAERDYTTLAYELAVRMPQRASQILATQRRRISNPDRLREFDFVSRAVSPQQKQRDELFNSLSDAANRRIEPWALSALYYLNHPLRDKEAVRYIRPALNLLPEIQRTGDIFFPGNWCSYLLRGHRCHEAYAAVEKYLKEHPDLMPLLKNKVLEAEYYLKRANK